MKKMTGEANVKKSKRNNKENFVGYTFVLPFIIAFIIFTGIPFIISMGLAFVNVKFITNIENLRFVWFDNFIRMFQSKETLEALWKTIQYSLLYVPTIMIIGFILALLLNKGVYFKKTVRAFMFLPYVSNMVAVAVIFKLLLGPKGLIGQFLLNLGLDRPLLLNTTWALPTVVMVAVWKGVGLNMITYIAALQGVSSELLEAAQIDGANKWEQIKHVTIPMVSPTTFFLIISSIITSLQNFTVIQSLTEGGPGRTTTVMSINIVRTAFVKYETSYASAQAMIMFAIVMIITIIQWRGQKKWVNY